MSDMTPDEARRYMATASSLEGVNGVLYLLGQHGELFDVCATHGEPPQYARLREHLAEHYDMDLDDVCLPAFWLNEDLLAMLLVGDLLPPYDEDADVDQAATKAVEGLEEMLEFTSEVFKDGYEGNPTPGTRADYWGEEERQADEEGEAIPADPELDDTVDDPEAKPEPTYGDVLNAMLDETIKSTDDRLDVVDDLALEVSDEERVIGRPGEDVDVFSYMPISCGDHKYTEWHVRRNTDGQMVEWAAVDPAGIGCRAWIEVDRHGEVQYEGAREHAVRFVMEKNGIPHG